ncbi:hypothetical protein [Microbacterium sp. BR1]|uniref:hypothetical protein n=1 Tax=Microbacterium sp. BR1 TaxID=1070896 RepID=UPI000C2C3282|nr:hypothetical protein [Microbacterium sp. BR1]
MSAPTITIPAYRPELLAPVLGGDVARAQSLLEAAASAGVLVRIRIGRDYFWLPVESETT